MRKIIYVFLQFIYYLNKSIIRVIIIELKLVLNKMI